MKYVVLKNSPNCLCVQLPEGFGKRLEILCFETQEEFAEFLNDEQVSACPICLSVSSSETDDQRVLSEPNCDGVFVRHNDFFKKILFSNIKWIEASRSYSFIHTTDNQRIILTHPLSDMKKKLPATQFVQPHRSYLLNVNYINKYIGNMLYIDDQSFPISRKFKKETLSRFVFLDNIKDEDENNPSEPKVKDD